jgi:hypothetical protein
MTDTHDRLSILEAVETGKLDVEEAVREIESGVPTPRAETDSEVPTPTAWYVLLGTAVSLTAGGGYLGSLGGWWWLIAAPLLLLGGLLLIVALASYRSPWLRLRIRPADHGWPIHLTIPLPLGFAAHILGFVSPFISDARWQGIDDLLLAIERVLPSGQGLVVDVSEGADGERVDVRWI